MSIDNISHHDHGWYQPSPNGTWVYRFTTWKQGKPRPPGRTPEPKTIRKKHDVKLLLVGGPKGTLCCPKNYCPGWWFQPLWKIWKSIGMIIPNIWKNKKCSKPPVSACFRTEFLKWIIYVMVIQHSGYGPYGCIILCNSCSTNQLAVVLNSAQLKPPSRWLVVQLAIFEYLLISLNLLIFCWIHPNNGKPPASQFFGDITIFQSWIMIHQSGLIPIW